jgi:hypothetical protein
MEIISGTIFSDMKMSICVCGDIDKTEKRLSTNVIMNAYNKIRAIMVLLLLSLVFI